MRTARCVGVAVVAVASVVGLTAVSASAAHATASTTRVLQLGAGRSQAITTLSEPDGVILLARISARRGVRAVVCATIPGTAGINVSTVPNARRDPSLACRAHGGMNVCTQAEEWCPMPAATWRLRVEKQSGPAAQVRVDLMVGPNPRSGS